jgi:putative transcriptional regulator
LSELKPYKGSLLIAEPSILNDDSFNRSIILLTEHNDQSSVGFILNRPLKFTLGDIIPEISCSFTIYQGGPVEQDNLYFVHKIPELIPDSIQVSENIYWGGNFNSLKTLLAENKIQSTDIRFFLGYSGWGTHQLEDELMNNSWFVSDNDFENIFSVDNETLWKNKLMQKGGEYKIWANAPSDIHLN